VPQKWSTCACVIKMCVSAFPGAVFLIQSASAVVYSMLMGVSASTADLRPWMSMHEMGDQTCVAGSEEPVTVGMGWQRRRSLAEDLPFFWVA
jgi:hypothetical protein